MFKVLLITGHWIYNVSPQEAREYREEGYHPIRM